MAFWWAFVDLLILCLVHEMLATKGKETASFFDYYTIQIAGSQQDARDIAYRNGVEYVMKVGELEGLHVLRSPRRSGSGRRRTNRSTKEELNRLSQDPQVKWVEKQEIHNIQRREKVLKQKASPSHLDAELSKNDYIPAAVFRVLESDSAAQQALPFNDPMWRDQWELHNSGQTSGPKGFDLNVMPAWKRNITGDGVVVTIIDDGIDHTHQDLKKNYDPSASFDFTDHYGSDHDFVSVLSATSSGHGTKCAGEVAMEANNSFCGVGVAYNARIGGIRLLDRHITDAMEAAALSYNNQHIDIYNCCWGPKDDGKKVDGPLRLASKALEEGAEKGRGGKGSIFIWASGNGGVNNDHCGADGYVNSIYTVAVGSISNFGLTLFYSEACSAMMAVVPTWSEIKVPEEDSADLDQVQVVTTELNDGCTRNFEGTSSAAPLAAGIIALVLQANPRLTWRDIQHLIAKTAKVTSPQDTDWKMNGGGYHVHDRYGFGLLDAGRLIKEALTWTNVNPQRKCVVSSLDLNQAIPASGSVTLNLTTDACKGTKSETDTLEHVQVTISLSSICRGDLSIFLTSPYGTVSPLLLPRSLDDSQEGLSEWTLMTVYSWGENPAGIWSVEVKDNPFTVGSCLRKNADVAGYVTQVTLTFYGTYQSRLIKRERADRMKASSVVKKQDQKDAFHFDQTRRQVAEAFLNENVKRVDENDIFPGQENVTAVEGKNGEIALRHHSSGLDDVKALLNDMAVHTQEAKDRA